MYYLQSRYYDPMVGRFINADTTEVLLLQHENCLQMNLFMYCINNPTSYTDDQGYWPRLAVNTKTSNFCSLLFVLPFDDVINYYKFKSTLNAVVGIAACFIPEPTVSKVVGVVSGVASLYYSDIAGLLSKYAGYDFYLRISFNYRYVTIRKYVYLVKTRFLEVGYWTKTTQVSISNFKCTAWFESELPLTGEIVLV